MSPFTIFRTERDEYQLVVVLQNDQACWFRCRGHELMGSYSESLTTGLLNKQTHCPWVQRKEGGSECRVRLVLDTSLDEVDRVKADGISQGWVQSIQRRRMARRLQVDYPSASIHRLPDYVSPDVLSIAHHLISSDWEEWLRLLQGQDVCITHVLTSLELFCDYSQDRSLSTEPLVISPDEKTGGPVLFNLSVGRERRHLLVDNGVPLFMRMVNVVDGPAESCDDPALQDSLQHARDQITHSERSPPVLVPDPPWPELEQKLHSASVLAALSIGSPVNLHCMPTVPGSETVNESNVDEAGTQRQRNSSVRHLIHRVSGPVAKLVRSRERQQRWRLTDNRRFTGDFLQHSITRNRLNQRIQQLQKATLICAWLAAASIAVASTHGINSAREKARLAKEHQQLIAQIDQLAETVTAVDDEPEFIVRSLARIEEHQSIKPVEAKDVLAIVASAINDHSAIVLDRLSWSVMADSQVVDSAFTVLSQVPQREQLWSADSAKARLQVDISGTVTDSQGLGLREQQRVLESFVAHLQSMPEVIEVQVLEAPVNAARSSHRRAQDKSDYHLSLQMGEY